jgi:hypothetical protein
LKSIKVSNKLGQACKILAAQKNMTIQEFAEETLQKRLDAEKQPKQEG